MVRSYSVLRDLQRAADTALPIRSQQRTDTCSRQEIGTPADWLYHRKYRHPRALPNAERRLKGASDMVRLFRHHSAALARTVQIAALCRFSLSELTYQYPDEVTEGDEAPMDRLRRLAHEGLTWRYLQGALPRALGLLEKERAVVEELNIPAYFLTVHDIAQYVRSQGILCQGRGSAANSILCYLLGITDVSPEVIGMVFERFISRHRGKPPDIDVDFEHERREEVIQWIYRKYGRHRAGLCGTVIHFRSRVAIHEVGKVMGLSQDVTGGLSGHVGGFVIAKGRADKFSRIENAAMEDNPLIEWDKDDIDALGILKVDVLGLGMLTCIRKAFELLDSHEKLPLRLDTVPTEDPETYKMLQVADTVGVFQVESRAQMNFTPRMKPKEFYDLVIEVAIVRPGPIQGGMVQPYIRRRQGLEQSEPFGPALEEVTKRTIGVQLFQEQACGSPPAVLSRSRALPMTAFPKAMRLFLRCYVSAWLKRHYPAVFPAH